MPPKKVKELTAYARGSDHNKIMKTEKKIVIDIGWLLFVTIFIILLFIEKVNN